MAKHQVFQHKNFDILRKTFKTQLTNITSRIKHTHVSFKHVQSQK